MYNAKWILSRLQFFKLLSMGISLDRDREGNFILILLIAEIAKKRKSKLLNQYQ